ncbi:hypothetical protein [Streptomyces avermitilis]|uniref:hypothetical protein n=1 Tax=Streptomyces avermitilis TaxID=33903 RepID=UPI0036C49D86
MLLVVWPVVLVAGCGSAGERSADVRRAVGRFENAVDQGDAAGMCAALAPGTAQELESSQKSRCVKIIGDEAVPAGGQIRSVDVYGHQARAVLARDTLFLSQFPGGWKVVAVGCTPQPGKPYECAVKGG